MRIHLIAIGGSVMHNLALELHAKGHIVTGSDDEIYNPARDRLEAAGLLPDEQGWDPDRIQSELEAVILGMHARPDNPELQKAQELGIPIYSFPAFIYERGKEKKRIVIAGSHGKTTTTSMIMHVLQKSNKAFDYLVGAQLKGFDRMVQLSEADILVLEGDEYLSSPLDPRPKFVHYHPHLTVITGIAWDHMNVFPTFDRYLDAFRQLLEVIEPGGKIFYFEEDPHLRELIARAPEHVQAESYRHFDYQQTDTGFVLELGDKRIPLPIFGRHNFQNLRAAYLVLRELGISDEAFARAIPSFQGAAKRLQLLAETERGAAFLDFAHAPSKVRATVEAVKERYPAHRIVAFFELHTYSSLNMDFIPQYANTLDAADEALVFFSPHALQMKKMPALHKEDVRKAFQRPDVRVFTDIQKAVQFLHDFKDEQVVYLLMSSGNLGGSKLKEQVVDWLS